MKKQSPVQRIWALGAGEHGRLITAVALAVAGVLCGMAPYFAAAKIIALLLGWLFHLHGSLTAQTFITVIILSLGTFWMKRRPTLTRRTRIACKRPLRP